MLADILSQQVKDAIIIVILVAIVAALVVAAINGAINKGDEGGRYY